MSLKKNVIGSAYFKNLAYKIALKLQNCILYCIWNTFYGEFLMNQDYYLNCDDFTHKHMHT